MSRTIECAGHPRDMGFAQGRALAETIRAALRDVNRRATVLRVLAAGPDHPVALAAPEGRYLKFYLLSVD